MAIDYPEEMSKAFVEAFNTGDLERLLVLYDSDAAYKHGDRTVTGHDEICNIFAQLIAVKPKMEELWLCALATTASGERS